jgi:HSP20 family molecular chaperone IbpA
MTRLSIVENPLLLGFDHVERVADRMDSKRGEGYPPYNIVQLGETGFRISLAVAGCARGELAISLDDHQLTIEGKQSGNDGGAVYLHRGIAAREFRHQFLLADGLEVTDASLEAGLLHINLARSEPESTTRTIEIRQDRS